MIQLESVTNISNSLKDLFINISESVGLNVCESFRMWFTHLSDSQESLRQK